MISNHQDYSCNVSDVSTVREYRSLKILNDHSCADYPYFVSYFHIFMNSTGYVVLSNESNKQNCNFVLPIILSRAFRLKSVLRLVSLRFLSEVEI